jgi:hypothetical protein
MNDLKTPVARLARAASGSDTEEDGGEEPPPALVPTRVTNHHHCLEVMERVLPAIVRASRALTCKDRY